MVVLDDPPLIRTMTLHLIKQVDGAWRDKWGTRYSLEAEGVDWSVFYRDRLLTHIRRGDPNVVYTLARRMAHHIYKGPEPQLLEADYELHRLADDGGPHGEEAA